MNNELPTTNNELSTTNYELYTISAILRIEKLKILLKIE